jgi:ADP-ribose pyrophosphatase
VINEYVQPVAEITRLRAIPVFRNRFGVLFNDSVLSPSGKRGRYLRWRWSADGVIAVPVHRGRLGLVVAYRYPIAAVSLEFPRGACDAREPADVAAARELREETGLRARSAQYLGEFHAETGLIENAVKVFRIEVDDELPGESAAEVMESIGDLVWVTPGEALILARKGKVTCALTLAAVYLAGNDASGVIQRG